MKMRFSLRLPWILFASLLGDISSSLRPSQIQSSSCLRLRSRYMTGYPEMLRRLCLVFDHH
ncbi:hypothetical protein QJS10_CPB04g01305 [Acorus calamus]|uniref:Uncharacterized protein n=1 Tax=Acorus calamus TaxID=4465 RepID=A0AAV9F2X7_ACOCL|nr:hypothetical protein QJS10_CPB04g01305 [Acorus calamus]